MKKIHPAFKNFILNDALNKWDDILKENRGVGVDAGVCFSTANAFCQILDVNLGIPCKLELVESTMGNKKAKELFDYYINEKKDFESYNLHLKEVIDEKGIDNLTSDDPVMAGIGVGKTSDSFHFVMNLPEQREVIDLTLGHYKRPHWGISCENYWAKYDTEKYKHGLVYSDDVWHKSGCVLWTMKKKTPASIGINEKQYQKEVRALKEYMYDEMKKKKIPVFFRDHM